MKGFTLIEMLVVIAAVSILSWFVLIWISKSSPVEWVNRCTQEQIGYVLYHSDGEVWDGSAKLAPGEVLTSKPDYQTFCRLEPK